MPFTRMSGPSSTASSSVMELRITLVAPYQPMFGAGRTLVTKETWTTAPPCSFIHAPWTFCT